MVFRFFDDMDQSAVLAFWKKRLEVSESQFYKTIVTKSRGVGNIQKTEAKYGVLTVLLQQRKNEKRPSRKN